jgi:hypothetical protein
VLTPGHPSDPVLQAKPGTQTNSDYTSVPRNSHCYVSGLLRVERRFRTPYLMHNGAMLLRVLFFHYTREGLVFETPEPQRTSNPPSLFVCTTPRLQLPVAAPGRECGKPQIRSETEPRGRHMAKAAHCTNSDQPNAVPLPQQQEQGRRKASPLFSALRTRHSPTVRSAELDNVTPSSRSVSHNTTQQGRGGARNSSRVWRQSARMRRWETPLSRLPSSC